MALKKQVLLSAEAAEKVTITEAKALEDISTGGNWTPAEPGRYAAIVTKIEERNYRGGARDKEGNEILSEDDDGKFKYEALRVTFQLLNDAQNEVRQDYTVGAVDEDGNIFRPDGNKALSPIWTTSNGAMFFFQSVGLYDERKGGLEAYDPALFFNRAVNVGVDLTCFTKSKTARVSQMDTRKFKARVQATLGRKEYTLDDLPQVLSIWDDEDGLTGDDVWKLKNVVYGVYRMTSTEAAEYGYFVKGNKVFVSEQDYLDYEAGIKAQLEPAAPTSKKVAEKAAAPKRRL